MRFWIETWIIPPQRDSPGKSHVFLCRRIFLKKENILPIAQTPPKITVYRAICGWMPIVTGGRLLIVWIEKSVPSIQPVKEGQQSKSSKFSYSFLPSFLCLSSEVTDQPTRLWDLVFCSDDQFYNTELASLLRRISSFVSLSTMKCVQRQQ